MRHKHADLIIAWANGAQIQIKYNDDEWVDVKRPGWHEDCEYKIKPEPELKLTFDGYFPYMLKSAEVIE